MTRYAMPAEAPGPARRAHRPFEDDDDEDDERPIGDPDEDEGGGDDDDDDDEEPMQLRPRRAVGRHARCSIPCRGGP
jgi:hypothetical protein